jgi:NADPH2:quinone reductase
MKSVWMVRRQGYLMVVSAANRCGKVADMPLRRRRHHTTKEGVAIMSTMRAIVINDWTPPDQLVMGEAPIPECGPRQVRIRVQSAAVSYSVSLLVQGKYQRRPPFPFVPGGAAAGIVDAVGPGATRFRPGDRVLAALELGGFAEFAVVHELNAYAIPDALPFRTANAFSASYNSALAALTWPQQLDLQAGQTLLVHGAAGGVGTAAIEIARILGAEVIATASTEAKRAWALARGAKHALASDPAALRDSVMSLTGGRGVDAVLDPVGGDLFLESLRCLRPEGRIVPIGFASGSIPKIPANLLLVKNISVRGLYMGYYKFDARERFEGQVRALFDRLGDWTTRGLIHPETTDVFALHDIRAAFASVLERGHIGHVALVMDEEARRLGIK